MRAKFRCIEVRANSGGKKLARLEAVVSGSPENGLFFFGQPQGKIEVGLLSDEAAKLFIQGKDCWVDFTPVG